MSELLFIVDNDIPHRKMMASWLEDQGYKVLAKRLRSTLKIIEEVDEQKPQSQAVIAGNI